MAWFRGCQAVIITACMNSDPECASAGSAIYQLSKPGESTSVFVRKNYKNKSNGKQ